MRVIHSPLHAGHVPDRYALGRDVRSARETPDRVDALLSVLSDPALRTAGLTLQAVQAPDHGLAAVHRVHDADYVEFLRTAHARWKASTPGETAREWVVPVAFPNRHMQARPNSVQGQAGYYLSSTTSPLSAGSWPAILGSAHCAIEGAHALLGGEPQAYALCRPPGHHAYADLGAGFCYLNNAAIAADLLATSLQRVTVLDIDVHHGNGTQGIFWDRGDVQFVSVHADPDFGYPYYAGRANETGAGMGAGTTLNLPLPLGSRDPAWLAALDTGLQRLRDYAPAALVVSLGFDAYEKDPSALLSVSTAAFQAAGTRIGALGLPTLLVQEGGYAVADLALNLSAFLRGFGTARGNLTLR